MNKPSQNRSSWTAFIAVCALSALGNFRVVQGGVNMLYSSSLHRVPGKFHTTGVTPMSVTPKGKTPRACLEACMKYGGCRSFNFNNATGACELLNITLCDINNTATALVRNVPGWSYYDVSSGPGEVTSANMVGRQACIQEGFCAKWCERGFGQKCQVDDQCLARTNGSQCDPSTKLCTCQASSSYVEGQCVSSDTLPLLAEPCNLDSECTATTAGSGCISLDEVTSTCQCLTGWLQWNNSLCLGYKKLEESCLVSNQCLASTPGSFCNSSGICQCATGYINHNNTTCVVRKVIGNSCANNLECTLSVLNSECNTTGVCACINTYYSLNATVCRPEGKILGDPCQNWQECQVTISNSDCLIAPEGGKKCYCLESGYVSYNETTCILP